MFLGLLDEPAKPDQAAVLGNPDGVRAHPEVLADHIRTDSVSAHHDDLLHPLRQPLDQLEGRADVREGQHPLLRCRGRFHLVGELVDQHCGAAESTLRVGDLVRCDGEHPRGERSAVVFVLRKDFEDRDADLLRYVVCCVGTTGIAREPRPAKAEYRWPDNGNERIHCCSIPRLRTGHESLVGKQVTGLASHLDPQSVPEEALNMCLIRADSTLADPAVRNLKFGFYWINN